MAYIGEIRMFGGTYAPSGWAFCNGQSLQISEYITLFDLIDFTYGGDGQTYFNLPDLRSRIPVGQGSNALGTFTVGSQGGTETVTLIAQNMPPHNHGVTGTAGILVSSEDGHNIAPDNNYPAVNGQNIYSTTSDGSQMAARALTLFCGSTGNSQPFSNIQPYLAINYIISLWGIYPST